MAIAKKSYLESVLTIIELVGDAEMIGLMYLVAVKAQQRLDYDAVVVGGGAAGCVAARGLAEAGLQTLLVERGPSEDEVAAVQVRSGFSRETFASEAYEPLRFKRGEWGGVAKVLGGGTALNQGLWIEETDEWLSELADHVGIVDKDDFVAGMRDAYDTVAAELATPAETHDFAVPGQQAFAEAHGKEFVGASRQLVENATWQVYSTLAQPLRHSTALLVKNVNRLTVLTDTEVERVLFNGSRAIGVRTVQGFDLFARSCVVLCAGAIYTPVLLLASNIGPRSPFQLEKLIVENDNVGQNFVDRPIAQSYRAMRTASEHVPGFYGYAEADFPDWTMHYTGGYNTLTGFVFTGVQNVPPEDRTAVLREETRQLMAVDCFASLIDDGLNVAAQLKRPQSRGTVTLLDGKPLVDSNVYSNVNDLASLVTALDATDDVLDATAFSPFIDHNRTLSGDCILEVVAAMPPTFDFGSFVNDIFQEPELNTLEDKFNYLNETRGTSWHYFGTAALGSVVDPETFEVLGDVTNLHVVDASVFPYATSVNPQSTIMAIALYAAERIADLYGCYDDTDCPGVGTCSFIPRQTRRLRFGYFDAGQAGFCT